MDMELLSVPKFQTKDEEIQYWKDTAKKTQQKKEKIKRELEEYQENSIILERELESSYEQLMEKNRNLQLANNKLMQDNEDLKARLHEQVDTCTQLQGKVQEMQNDMEGMKENIRKLEMKNDDLERNNRELKVSEEAMEDQFNEVVERLALLETEVEEKEGLQIIIQRLKDENQDLKHQIAVDLRKTHGSPMTRIRKLSMARRHHRRGSDVDSEKSLSIHENPNEICLEYRYKNEISELREHVAELEREIDELKRNQSTSKIVVVDVGTESNSVLETDFFGTAQMDNNSMPGCSNDQMQMQEAQVRLRPSGGISVTRGTRPNSSLTDSQEEAARAQSPSLLSLGIMREDHIKLNSYEKERNLIHFLKRFREKRISRWMRTKKH